MITAAEHELTAAGITDTPAIVLADAGYWHQAQMEQPHRPRNGGADLARRRKRRGRSATRSEWRVITATHNLLKLHRQRLAITAGA
jgi:hypothetical protein